METLHLEEGGFRPSSEQLSLLSVAGYPLIHPVEYVSPNTVEAFRGIQLNNFCMHFWFNGEQTPSPRYRNRYMFAGKPCFERLMVLYPDFVEGTRTLVDAYTVVDLDIKHHSGGDGQMFTRAEHDTFYEKTIEPRFFTAWSTMSQLVDRSDEDYQFKLKLYENTTPQTAVYFLLSA
jgi:hypothetical protein